MRSPRRRRDAFRKPRFESIEPRLVLSAEPAAVFDVDPAAVSLLGASAAPTIMDAHALTGLTDARGSYNFTGQGQTVVIIDSGVAYTHTALGGGFGPGFTVVGGWDFTEENDADPYDDGPYGSHGTHVAGIIASADPGNPGVAPGVDLVALRVFNDAGRTQLAWVENALRWVHDNRFAFDNPITTVNLSMGMFTNTSSPPDGAVLEDELAQLAADGIFVTAAAGNGFTRFEQAGLSYPASSPHVVAAGSVDSTGELSYFTQRDASMLAAPGRSVNSTVPDYVGNRNGVDDDYGCLSGTSMASPYIAGAAVLVREAYESIGMAGVSPQVIYQALYDSADLVHDAATGQDYRRLNIGRAIDSVLAAAQTPPASPQTPPESPGLPAPVAVDQVQLDGQTITAAGKWYAYTATRDGLFTVEATFNRAQGGVNLEVFDSGQQRLGGSYSASGSQRVDVTVSAGQSIYVRAWADGAQANPGVRLRVTNLVKIEGGSVLVNGTAGSDRFEFAAGAEHQVRINGVEYRFDGAVVNTIALDGLAGSDTAELAGSEGSDTASLRPGAAELSGPGYTVAVANAETIRIDGRGGQDTAALDDSPGDDVLTAAPGLVQLTGAGFALEVRQFEEVHAYARAGGVDEASLYDSQGDDLFVGTPEFGRLTGEGFVLRAKFFEAVHAYASGGNDRAQFQGSASADLLLATPVYAKMVSQGRFNRAKYFDEVVVFAGGGYDRAYLYDSPADDTLVARPDGASFYGPGFYYALREFEALVATASEGSDTADFHGSAGADAFFANSVEARMSGSGYSNRATGFGRITARGNGGFDEAMLFDSVLSDAFVAGGNEASLSNTAAVTWVCDFDQVRLFGDSGGRDTAEVAAVDYVLEILGPWRNK